MSDQKKPVVVEEETSPLAELTAKIKQLEEESAKAKVEYDKDRKALIAQALDGGKVEVVEGSAELEQEEARLRKKFGEGGMSNYETVKTSLALRDVGIKLRGIDSYQVPNAPDPQSGHRVAETLRKILEASNGDEASFLIAYNSTIRDNPNFMIGN